MIKRNALFLLFWIIGFTALVLFANKLDVPIKYFSTAELEEAIQKDRIESMVFDAVNFQISGNLKLSPREKISRPFKAVAVGAIHMEKIRESAEKKGIKITSKEPPNPLFGILLNILLFVALPIGFLFFVLKKQNSQISGKFEFLKSNAKLSCLNKDGKTFADIAGCDEAKESLLEVVEFLKNPTRFAKLGGKVPRGVLLYGEPGTGKTLLAKAVAGEAGVPFFAGSGSEFVEMFVGVGASRVRSLFENARKAGRAIIFIDELDAVGRHRFAGIGGGHDEREQTLNQILTELDGFETIEGIIVIAATNRPDVLDPALLRPGRFDRRVQVPAPDLNGREQILKVHAKKILLDKNVDLRLIAKQTPGFVGADLANLLNEAALFAARNQKDSVEQSDIEKSIETVIAGPQKKSRLISEEERKIIAYHECGHTLAAMLTLGTDPVHKVSIISRGQALGYTLQLPEQDKALTSKQDMLKRIRVLLGGRVAEEILLGADKVTGGACDDLNKATRLLEWMVMELGMGRRLSVIALEEKAVNRLMVEKNIPPCSEQRRQEIHDEVEESLQNIYKEVRELLDKNRAKLDILAAKLMEKEELDGKEINRIINSA